MLAIALDASESDDFAWENLQLDTLEDLTADVFGYQPRCGASFCQSIF